jgi:hypothetical protein
MRVALAALLAASAAGPWSGCDRAPVAPPASPPAERAPRAVAPASQSEGVVLIATDRLLG